jgi:hypothetical protein
MKLIESKTIGTAQAAIEFTSIPSTFTDLVVLLSSTSSGQNDSLIVRFNNDTENNYSWRRLFGSGSGGGSSDSASSTNALLGPQISTTISTTTFGNISIYIPNYSGSTSKSASFDGVTEANAATAIQGLLAGLYTPTTEITAITLRTFFGNNFSIGTTASLYGITKGSDGIVTTTP